MKFEHRSYGTGFPARADPIKLKPRKGFRAWVQRVILRRPEPEFLYIDDIARELAQRQRQAETDLVRSIFGGDL